MLRYERPLGQDHLQILLLRAVIVHLQQQMHLVLLVKINRETTDVGETTLAPPADRRRSIQKMSQDQKHHEIGPDSTSVQA